MTAALKIGDLVHVEFVGVVAGLDTVSNAALVTFYHPLGPYWLPTNLVTKTAPAEPAWHVGDAIVMRTAKTTQTLVFDGMRWSSSSYEQKYVTRTRVSSEWALGNVTRLVEAAS